ncbi:MAG TPA: amylo-alpha-1,6-glucosidase [Chitinophagales bacterium]|nr:amylo-alpha-1,6-glucosidase [Chitinophagales bacterium]
MNYTFESGTKLEWLETNGLGGYASSSLIGAHTRRYHSLLIASMKPPVERLNLLSKLDETLIDSDERFELGSNQYKDAIHPQGFSFLKSFTRDLFPEFLYEMPNGTSIRKTIAAVHRENTTLIIYKVLTAPSTFKIEFLPLVAFRDFHSLSRENNDINREANFQNGILRAKAYRDSPELFISIPDSSFNHQPDWYRNFEYAEEQYRGLDFTEDLFTHGKFLKEAKADDEFGIIISTENPGGRDAVKLFKEEFARREKILSNKKYSHPVLKTLALAADQFIVKRGEDLKTIIAGYHWFSDWGRDTMIALPGLCLTTERFADAKKILSAFAKSVSQGMLPNRFPDYGEAPEYNTADATLWFFIAIHKYFEASSDKKFVLKELLPVLKDIIAWHFKGTRYNIHTDEDGLLYAGTEGQQLTWMDARIDSWVVTPRIGKPVEINALWYNALMIYADLLKLNGEKSEAKIFSARAEKVKEQFPKVFWNEEMKCLYDCVNGAYKDPSIRPNQLFSISLPFPLMKGKQAKSILKIVKEKLYTPAGLRSLSADHADYKPHYGGNQLQRDSAYHQGTIWDWLLGAYVDAIIKVDGAKGKSEAKQVIEDFKYHLSERCIGSVSEIMDAEPPFTPRGCVAQAWSVGEILRVIIGHKLFEASDAKKNRKKSSPKNKGSKSQGDIVS